MTSSAPPAPTKTEKNDKWAPPYTSFTTLTNTLDRMATEGGAPSRLDRSYLSNMQGGARATFVAALKALGLLDKDAKPTPTLVQLVGADEARRKEIYGELVREHYGPALALDPMATQAQLESIFREYNISGSTLRKAVGFFLAAARAADIKVSPHFKLPKVPPGEPRRAKKKETTEGAGEGAPTTPEKPSKTPPAAPDMHPFIQGLIATLPKVGDKFPKAKQDAWFEIAKNTFRLIYKTEPDSVTSSVGGDEG